MFYMYYQTYLLDFSRCRVAPTKTSGLLTSESLLNFCHKYGSIKVKELQMYKFATVVKVDD